MTRLEQAGEMRIGEVLKSARRHSGLDIGTVEERTKIRTKYLRALEAEEWEVLPSPAYANGFLRTYATLLGLDADAIVDEYRREAETDLPEEHRYPLGEPLLESRRRPGDDGQRLPPARAIAAGLAAIVILLLVLAITGGGDEGGQERAGKRERQTRQEQVQERRREELRQPPTPSRRVALRLEINSTVPVCLVGDGEQPLIDDQLLGPGAVEGPYSARRFELRFPSGYDRGQLDLLVAGRRRRLPELTGPAAFRIVPPGRIRSLDTVPEACP